MKNEHGFEEFIESGENELLEVRRTHGAAQALAREERKAKLYAYAAKLPQSQAAQTEALALLLQDWADR